MALLLSIRKVNFEPWLIGFCGSVKLIGRSNVVNSKLGGEALSCFSLSPVQFSKDESGSPFYPLTYSKYFYPSLIASMSKEQSYPVHYGVLSVYHPC